MMCRDILMQLRGFWTDGCRSHQNHQEWSGVDWWPPSTVPIPNSEGFEVSALVSDSASRSGNSHLIQKPRNILVNSNCDIKICDFGLAKPILMEVKAKIMTDYMTTRWYRAPELLFGAPHYTTAVDIWSVGCIFAELLRRKPFLQGSDSQNQLELIQENLGTIKVEEIKGIT